MYKPMSKKVVAFVLIGSMLGTTIASASEINKDESVYVNLNSEGKVTKETVTNWVHTDEGDLNINDKSSLNNIENIKGDEEPTKDGENLKWNIKGSDLYYKGETNKELPIDVNIKYYLDDKEIKGEDLIGKSGKFKMEMELKNKSSKEVDISGEKRKIYTPIITASVVTLPVDKFKDIKVNSGEIISEGNNNIVAFASVPGLKESLNLKDDTLDLDLEEKLVIEGNVENFELGPIMITATSEMPDLDKLEKSDSLDKVMDALGDLKDASNKLLDGTNLLSSGINEAKGKLDQGKVAFNNNLKEAMSLLSSDQKVKMANKLIEDAYFAKDLDTAKLKEILSLLTDENINEANKLIKDTQGIMEHKGLIESSVNVFKGLANDNNFNKLLNDVSTLKGKYDNIDNATLKKLETLMNTLNKNNLTSMQNLVKGMISLKGDFTPVDNVIKSGINSAPGGNMEEKGSNFIKGLNANLNKTATILSNENLSELNGIKNDVSVYGSSYLIMKGIIASDMKNGTSLNESKANINKSIDEVYGSNGAALKNIVNSFSEKDFTQGSIASDVNKISKNGEKFNSLMNDIKGIKGLEPMIKATTSVLSKNGEAEKIAKIYSGLNNEQNKNTINGLAQGFLSLSEKDINELMTLKDSINEIQKDIENNKSNIEAINKMVEGLKGNPDLVEKLNTFSKDLKNSNKLINDFNKVISQSGDSKDINQIKKLGKQLLSMQQDLKDGEDILRITKGALEENNINRARELVKALPTLEAGVDALAKGSTELNNGMKEFNKEGINKLYDTGEKGKEEVDKLLAAKDELVKMSKEYDTFTGKDENMNGSVKFIMKTDELKAKEETKESVEEEENGGFINWIKEVFNKIFG